MISFDIVLAATMPEAKDLVAERYPGARAMSVQQPEQAYRGVRVASCYVTRSAVAHPKGTRAVALMRYAAAKAGGTVHLLDRWE